MIHIILIIILEVSLAEREMILVTNYFGLYTRDIYDQFIKKYNAIIFDNTQSFFDDPIIKEHIYNIYSPRKFLVYQMVHI